MPVAHRSILEDSQHQKGVDEFLSSNMAKPPSPPRVDLSIFEQIKESIDKMNSCKDGTSEDKRKIEKLSKHIEAAEETINRAEDKRDALLRKNNFLRAKLDKLNERKSEAIKYWQDYGFDVKQLSKSDDNFDLYEFIYTKLNNQELLQPITVGLKLQDKKLQIVSRLPTEALSDEVIETLNSRLGSDCCQPGDEHIDYKLAMLRIRKALLKHPDV